MSQSQSEEFCLICRSKAKLIRRMSESIIKLIKHLTKYKNVTSENRICETCLELLKQKLIRKRALILTQPPSISTDSSTEESSRSAASRKRALDSNEESQSNSSQTSQPLPKRHSVIISDLPTTSSSPSDDFVSVSTAPRQQNVRINDLIGYRRTTGG